MDEYITKESVHTMVRHLTKFAWASPINSEHRITVDTDDVHFGIDKIPAADVAPVAHGRHGRWEYIPQTLNTLSQLRCPFCGWWSLDPSIDGTYNYCPNCGEKMDGGADCETD